MEGEGHLTGRGVWEWNLWTFGGAWSCVWSRESKSQFGYSLQDLGVVCPSCDFHLPFLDSTVSRLSAGNSGVGQFPEKALESQRPTFNGNQEHGGDLGLEPTSGVLVKASCPGQQGWKCQSRLEWRPD